MTGRALRAIVGERLRVERRSVFFCCAAAAIVAFVRPHGMVTLIDPLTADIKTRSEWLAAPMFFCSIIAIAIALVQGPGRHPYLDESERAAPLFGRELARAKALVPAIAVFATSLIYWIAQAIAGVAAPPTYFAMVLASSFATALVAIGATVREGWKRRAFIIGAAATTLCAYVLGVYADALTTRAGHLLGAGAELIFCGVVGFAALRDYGEALAHLSPVPLRRLRRLTSPDAPTSRG